jgi:hypothetical protein
MWHMSDEARFDWVIPGQNAPEIASNARLVETPDRGARMR